MRTARVALLAALLAAPAGAGYAGDSGRAGGKPSGGTGLGSVMDKAFGPQFDDVEKRVAEMREEFKRLDEIAQRTRIEDGRPVDRRSSNHRLAQEFLDRATARMQEARRNADSGDAQATSNSLLDAASSIFQAKSNADEAWRELGYDPATQQPLDSAPAQAAPPAAQAETRPAPATEPAPAPPEPEPTPLTGVPRIPRTPSAPKRASLTPQSPVPLPTTQAAARPALQGDAAPSWLADASQAQSAATAPAEAARARSGRPAAAPGRPLDAARQPGAGPAPAKAPPALSPFRDSGVKQAVEAARESLGLAEEALRRGDYAAAESHARDAAAADPASGRAFELMSWAQLKQRKWKDALVSAKKAAELQPGAARPHLLAALAHEKLGERRAALLEVAEAARLDPRYEPALARARAGRDIGDETMEDELFLTDMLFQPERSGAGRLGRLLLFALSAAAAGVGLRNRLRASPQPPVEEAGPAAAATAEQKYELARLLGRRDGTEVWQAKDRILGREVALVRRKAPVGDAARTAFVQQARRAAALRHPALIELYEVVERADEVWLVYEALRGMTLAQCLQQERRLPVDRAIEFLDPVCRALEFAHGRGMFHGALGPAAIVLVEGGFVKLRELGGVPGADRAADVRGLAACLEAMVGPEALPFAELALAGSAAEFLRRARAASAAGAARKA